MTSKLSDNPTGSRLRVLLLWRPDSLNAAKSGVHRYFYELVKAMDESVEYVYLTASDQESEIAQQAGNEARSRKRHWLPGDLALFGGYCRETFALARQLRRFRKRVDVLHVVAGGCEISPIAGRLAGFKRILDTVQVMHGMDAPAQHWLRRFVERLCFRCSDYKIVVSDATYEDWRSRVRLCREECLTIYNGMQPPDYSGFDRKAYRGQFCDNADKTILIGICARLHPMKGHSVLLEAFAQLLMQSGRSEAEVSRISRSELVEGAENGDRVFGDGPQSAIRSPQIILLIAGDGPERANIETKIKELGIEGHVRLLGHRIDAIQFVASLDIHVLPSISQETIGYANVEAMFAGVPCIVSDTGGMKEIIGPSGGGRIVPALDVGALCDAMRFYIHNAEARREDGQRGKRFAHKRLTAKVMVEATRRVYDRVATGGKRC